MSKQTFTVEVEAIRPLTAGEVRQAIIRGQSASTRTAVTETTPFDPQPGDRVKWLNGVEGTVMLPTGPKEDQRMIWVRWDNDPSAIFLRLRENCVLA